MTYQNLGYWIGQSNDTSTGSHPTGWTNGQRWSETASEWNTMYSSSQSALASMTTDRDTWANRANQAYGPARTWGTPPSFESLQAPAAPLNFVGPVNSDSFPNSAGTERGLNFGAATENGLGATNGTTYVAVPKTGYYEVVLFVTVGQTGNTNDNHTLRLKVGGGTVVSDTRQPSSGNGSGTALMCRYQALLSAGNQLSGSLQNQFDNNAYGGGVSKLMITFIPTATYPN